MEKIFRNKRIHIRLPLFILVFLLLILTACGSGKTDPRKEVPDDGQIINVLKVGDRYISNELLDEFTIFMLSMYAVSQMMDYDTLVNESVINEAKPNVLDMMAETEALRLYYKDVPGVIPDLTEELVAVKEEILASEGIAERFEQLGVTDASFIYYLETNYLHEHNRMEATNNGAYPSDDDVNSFYEENIDQFYVGERRQSSHILFEDAEHKEETKALAKDIRDQIISGAVTFEEMAAEYNTDSTKETGGDLGPATTRGQFVPEFDDVLFEMKIGDISDVVETQFGYHIIKLNAIEEDSFTDLEDVRDNIANYLSNMRENESSKAIVAETTVEYLSELYPAPDERAAPMPPTP